MTKSIEEQAKEYAAMAYASPKEKVIAMMAYDHGANWAAKDRDARWSAVVSELRDALKFYADKNNWYVIMPTADGNRAVICDDDWSDGKMFDHTIEGAPTGGKKAREYITKADQMIKDMGVKL